MTSEQTFNSRFFFFSFNAPFPLYAAAPPDVAVEKTWVHAAVGAEAELVCVLHSDPTSDVSETLSLFSTRYFQYVRLSANFCWHFSMSLDPSLLVMVCLPAHVDDDNHCLVHMLFEERFRPDPILSNIMQQHQ